MKIKYLTIIAIIFSTLFYACKTDVDAIADYKELAVVYGLLDVSQPIQYIKINKVFLGKGDAYVMAQNPDSSNFTPENMNIVLEKYNGNEFLGTIVLFDTIIPGGSEGAFSKSKNIIYATKEILEENLSYKLKIENKKTGYKAESSTGIINKINIPAAGSAYAFTSPDNKPLKSTVEWYTQKNGKIYELTFRFHYKEFKNGGDTVFKYADWPLGPQYATDVEGGAEMSKSIQGLDFYSFLKSVKSVYFSDNTVKRIAWRGQVFVTAAGEDFQIYKDLNAPYSSNFQEKPIYTNIENGIGIFSTRVTTFGIEKPFSSPTINEIVNSTSTNDLGFIRP